MKLNVVFTLAAVLLLVLGLGSLLAPAAMLPIIGLSASAASFFLMGEVGVLSIGLGLVAWLVRNSDASKARDGVVLGFTIFNTLFALFSLYTQLFTDAASGVGWIFFIIQGLFAIGFFMAGKASMSETAR
jgi:hypothetical protein